MDNKHILVVDDDETIRMGLEIQLESEGYNVAMAESGENAIALLDKKPSFDLVITDLRMHELTGVDVLKEVLKINVNIPVMVISGFGAETPLFKEAMEFKPCAHAFKPFPKEELLRKVRNCLDSKE